MVYKILTNYHLDIQTNTRMHVLSIFHTISITLLLLLNKEQPTNPHAMSLKSSVKDLSKPRRGTRHTEELLQTSHSPPNPNGFNSSLSTVVALFIP